MNIKDMLKDEIRQSKKLAGYTPSARQLKIKELEKEQQDKTERKAAVDAAEKTRQWKKTGRPLVVGFFVQAIVSYSVMFSGHFMIGLLMFWGFMLAGLLWAMFQD